LQIETNEGSSSLASSKTSVPTKNPIWQGSNSVTGWIGQVLESAKLANSEDEEEG
jgi:hypothetical protein